MNMRTLFPWKRVLQLMAVLFAISMTLGATDANSRFETLGHKLMCQCGCNQVLLECNHVGCTVSERMRGELTGMINKGDSDQTILNNFVQKYGSIVLAAPTDTGFNRVAWIMPYLALLVGFGICVLVVRTWKHRRPALATADGLPQLPDDLDEYRKRVHRETEI